MRVLICPDKFKGTLTATQAADAIAAGWRRARPSDTLDLLPISDGGDGFGELLGLHLGAEEQVCETVDAAHRPIRASWWWEPKQRLAIIEAARIIGLAMLPPGRFHPFDLDTFGLGAVLRAAAAKRPRSTVIGIGGSATNDAGFGMARSLGWKFLDATGQPIERWLELTRLERVVGFSSARIRLNASTAVDVENPLLGRRGATRVYGPQKGMRPEDMRPAERAFERLIEVFEEQDRWQGSLAFRSGAGAAGGLGFGLSAFVGGPLEPGFEHFARETHFAERAWQADLVVTGEGAIDETTVRMGKGVGQIARLRRQARKPCIGLAGSVAIEGKRAAAFTRVAGVVPGIATLEEAKANAAKWLAELAFHTASTWPSRLGRRGRCGRSPQKP